MTSSSFITRITIFLLFLFAPVHALRVTPGSSCASVCLDQNDGDDPDPKNSTTRPSDIVCKDVEYYSTHAGVKFRKCMDCLQKSPRVDGEVNDIAWFLSKDNVRYAVNVCLFGFPNATQGTSSPCNMDLTCRPLQTPLKAGISEPSRSTEFQYCGADHALYGGNTISSCEQCLQMGNEKTYLSNFITALHAGCQQQPVPGTLLGLSGSLFSNDPVNITAPPVAEPPLGPSDKGTGMTVGAVVGIAVGAALVFLGGVALFIVHWRRQRRSSKYEDIDHGSHYPPKSNRSSSSATHRGGEPYPMSDYKSQIGVYESTMDPPVYKGITSHRSNQPSQQHDFSNNGEYYDQVDRDYQARQRPTGAVTAASAPTFGQTRDGTSLPTHPAYVPRAITSSSRIGSSQPPIASPPPAHKAERSKSHAVQAYLDSLDQAGSTNVPPPPAQVPPVSQSGFNFGVPPPPPPPRREKVPSLALPSVPRMKVPKKYNPPRIQIQEASPVTGPRDNISLPIPRVDEDRFRQGRGRSSSRERDGPSNSSQDRIVQHFFRVDESKGTREMPIQSGKSQLYG
ncbi:uncharacterized protein E0L32_009148 [Thyridium curvatum]|uniref:LPXTG-domain-containing protein n=1 Tax=Thyridium curvatum TaxID=1093900 RepID=A0A507AHZ3_9PEZI|nr:uncharacterized protein E0L32_009148 [Thyridium curvatum]TPX09675.1 hypothetical protein E0L32_009148 [Thyridium curvatum]